MYRLVGKITWLYWRDISINRILKHNNVENRFKTKEDATKQLDQIKYQIRGLGHVQSCIIKPAVTAPSAPIAPGRGSLD